MSKDKKKIGLAKRGLLISKTLLFRMLLSRANGIVNNPARVMKLARSAYRKMKEYDNTSQMTNDLVGGFFLFGEMLKYWAKGEYKGFENNKILLILGALLYLISPLDVIPDVVPVLGFVDDLSLLAWLFQTMRKEVEQFVTWKNENGNVQLDEYTYDELYAMAQAINLRGRSKMSKTDLVLHLSKTKK